MRRFFKTKMATLALLASMMAFSGVMTIGCHGKYAMFNAVHKWNGGIGSKWVRSIVHFGMWVIPVYEVSLTVDFLILNTIEFWVGSNPMAMEDGESDTRMVEYKGDVYSITATKNRFTVVPVTGEKAGKKAALVYVPAEQAWYARSGETSVKLMEHDVNNPQMITLLFPDGSEEVHNLDEAH